MKIAIVQWAAWGDVIISTSLLRAIKQQHPTWHITYYTSSNYAGALENNPDVDALITKDITREHAFPNWEQLTAEVKSSNLYEKVISPWPGLLPQSQWRLKNMDDSIENNFMWAYPRAAEELGIIYDPPIKSYLHPTKAEQEKVENFISTLDIQEHVLIMMEIQANSRQTYWDQDWTNQAVELLNSKFPQYHLFISQGGDEPEEIRKLRQANKSDQQIHHMGHFSIREMSVMFNYCEIMFSVSSGTANTCMTHQCKAEIKWFEAVNDTLWDSSPMGNMASKFIYHHNNKDEYFREVEKRL